MHIDAAVDNLLVLDDGVDNAVAVGDNIGQVGSSNAFVDLGVDFARNPELVVSFDIESLDFTTTDETYTLKVEFSDTNVFTVVQSSQEKIIDPSADAGPQRHELVCKAEGQFVRIVIVQGGTTPITNLNKAYIAPVAA